MSANILQENLDLLLTEFGSGILNDSAALRRVVDITSTNNTSVVLEDVGENIVTLDNFINTATLNSPINTATLNSTINTV